MHKRFISICCIALFLVTGQVRAQQSVRLLQNWEFLQLDLGGVWEAVRPVGKGNPESVPLWQQITLPHCVNALDAVDPDVNYYQGPSWYRTSLKIVNPYPGGRTLLHFEGAGQKTEVYVYNKKVGSHVGGYDEWTVDITDAVDAFKKTAVSQKQYKGTIPVAIRTDNSRDLEMIPSSLSDFNIYGGIYRYLNLVYTPAVAVERFFAKGEVDASGKNGHLQAKIRIYDPGMATGADGRPSVATAGNAKLLLKLIDPQGKLITKTEKLLKDYTVDRQTGLSADMSCWDIEVSRPRLWSTAVPLLYTVQYELQSSSGIFKGAEKIGFRNFEFVEKGPFLLNGKRLLLRGTHRHEDHAGVAAAMTERMIVQEMQMMKDMGVNFIRLAHYQQSRIVLNLCDSLGILVWEEIPWCRGGLGGPVYQEQARRMLTNMIEQHQNHASVIIWGLGNEKDWPGDFPEFDQLKIRAFMKELNDLSHQLDHSRLTAIRRCDFCSDLVDVYSPSIWAGWYRGNYTDYKQVTEEEFKKVKRFIHVEWGGDSHTMRHSENPDNALSKVKSGGGADERAGDASLFGGAARISKDGDWSESYVTNLIDWHLKEQENMPWLTGTAYWPFKDFSTPVRPDNPIPYMNQKGVTGRDFQKKEAYYVFQSYWTEKPMLHIYGHTWPVRWGDEGEQKMVKVYSNCQTAELFLNGKSFGTKKRNSQDFPAAGLRWNLPFLKGKNVVTVLAKKGKAVLKDEISFIYQTEKWGKPEMLVLSKVEQDDDLATVEVKVYDSKKIQCLDAVNQVSFSLAGEGQLIADQGTVTGSKKVQVYNGRALISIKLNRGQSVVSVSAEGMPAAFITLSTGSKEIQESASQLLRKQVLEEAEWAMQQQPVTITSFSSPRSAGGKHDFFSEADYFWPDPKNPDGPYINRDGLTNPDNFLEHRKAMLRFSKIIGALASAYQLTHQEKYVKQAIFHLRAWFINPETLMNPDLLFAQAVKGRFTGRNYGIIDTIHLMEVAQGIIAMENASSFDAETLLLVKDWFAEYTKWLNTSKPGIQEKLVKNNHATCWAMQVASFATLCGDQQMLDSLRTRFKTVLLPNQMAADGSFPLEMARTKPYGYSIFNLDAMTMLCQILSVPGDNLWDYETADGKSIKKGIANLYPFIADKSKWTVKPDVMFWDNWPVAQPFLLFGAAAYNQKDWYKTWEKLDHQPGVEEVIRNLPVRHPLIWFTGHLEDIN